MGDTQAAGLAHPRETSGSTTLSEADVCATYRVVLDSLDVGYDPVEWRRVFMARLGRLTGGDLCQSLIMPADPTHRGSKIPLAVFHSDSPDGEKRFRRFNELKNVPEDPVTPVIMRAWDQPQTALVSDLMDFAEWSALPYVRRVYHAVDIYDWIHSRVPLPQVGQVSVLGLSRRKDQPRFSERERRIVEIAHAELAARVALPPDEGSDAIRALPTRLQELATHLRGPMSKKEIAREMGLSPHTIHNYARTLFRRLGVSSRNEAAHALKARDGRSGTRNEVVLA